MIGEVRMFAGNFAPKNWAYCQGQIIAIASNTALFSILGTTYGGNGTTTFALPNMSGRACVGAGQGPGLSYYALGQVGGEDNVTLTVNQMPAHVHTANGNYMPPASTSQPEETNPTSGYFAISNAGDLYRGDHNVSMGASPINVTISSAGGNQPHYNLQPYLGMNYVICMYGIFPSRG